MKVLIASTNNGKIAIYKQILSELNIDCLSLRDIESYPFVEESGETTAENAIIKAKAYHEATGYCVIANDSGLNIAALSEENQPGAFVRRYGGRELSDEETIVIFEKLLNEVGGSSAATFTVSLAIIDEKGTLHQKDFYSHRFFTTPACKARINGLPLRSFEFCKNKNKFVSEMTIKEQNENEGQCLIDQADFIKAIFSE